MSFTNTLPQPIPQLGSQLGPTRSGSEISATWLVHSQDLLGSTGQVDIVHHGEIYRLRRTRLGKLILTK